MPRDIANNAFVRGDGTHGTGGHGIVDGVGATGTRSSDVSPCGAEPSTAQCDCSGMASGERGDGVVSRRVCRHRHVMAVAIVETRHNAHRVLMDGLDAFQRSRHQQLSRIEEFHCLILRAGQEVDSIRMSINAGHTLQVA